MVLYTLEVPMAYFLKKSHLKKGLYLQIYESFYDHSKRIPLTNHSDLWVTSMISLIPVSLILSPFSLRKSKNSTMSSKTRKNLKKSGLSRNPLSVTSAISLSKIFLMVSGYLNISTCSSIIVISDSPSAISWSASSMQDV